MSYTAADITELDDVQHTRMRPAVNLGSDVYLTAAREILDNSIEEVSVPAHGGTTVTITLHADRSLTVADDGRGLPVDSDPVTGKNGILKTLGTARAGGKFGKHTAADNVGAGLNGIGAAAAVFISTRTDVSVKRAGKTYVQQFRAGYPGRFDGDEFDPDAPFIRDDTQELIGVRNGKPREHGTAVRILLDWTLAPDLHLNIAELLLRAHASARMSPGVSLRVIDEGWPEDIPENLLTAFTGPWGTSPLLDLVTSYAGAACPPANLRATVDGRGEYVTGRGATPFTWSLTAGPVDDGAGSVSAFCNTVRTPNGGSHLNAAVRGLTEALAERASRMRDLGLAKGETAPEAQDFAAVTALALDTRAPDAPWDSQAKTAVSSRSLMTAMSADVARSVTVWAANPAHTPLLSAWARVALESARARRSAEGAKARSRAASKAKGLGTNLSLPEKLLPCKETGRGSGAELYVAEGDSALGTIKAARDATFQAAFPLKGKPPNTFGYTLAKARSKAEFEALERILGCGCKDNCDPEQCRYDRLLLAADADVDGGSICSLLISMLLEFHRPLIEAGMVYVTQPPLFVVSQGDQRIYCQTESDRDVAVAKLRAASSKKVDIQRNKGLGEMNADDFWNTVLDPEQRTLLRITPDTPGVDGGLRYTLFGGAPEGRRNWIADCAAHMDLTTLDMED